MKIHNSSGFDNRTILDRNGFGAGQKMIDRLSQHGDVHFICDVGKIRLGYCYIRKNACSSFKRMFLDMCKAEFDPASGDRRIDFMIRHQMMRSADAARCDRIVFVYRDPVERIVSLFKNKFIMRDGYEDLFQSYAASVGEDPNRASFRRFVQEYLRRDLRGLDPHVLPQAYHLKRFRYTDAIPIQDLHQRMAAILGEELAGTYFKRPVNATSSAKIELHGAMDTPAEVLAERFSAQNTMPRDEDLLDQNLKASLREIYAADAAMIADIMRLPTGVVAEINR